MTDKTKISSSEKTIMSVIFNRNAAMSATELAKRLPTMERPALYNSVNSLVEKGLIEQNEELKYALTIDGRAHATTFD